MYTAKSKKSEEDFIPEVAIHFNVHNNIIYSGFLNQNGVGIRLDSIGG